MDRADRIWDPAPSSPMDAGGQLFELQVEQHHHDEMYHREIARLPMHQRLNHMALHFAKYTGKIARAEDVKSTAPIFVDMLIIVLSTANILNLNLWEIIDTKQCEFVGLRAFGLSLAINMPEETNQYAILLRETAIAAGRMAAACEKIDHLEEISFRSETKMAIARLGCLSLAVITLTGNEPSALIRTRLAEVKQRLKLYGRI